MGTQKVCSPAVVVSTSECNLYEYV